MANSTTLISDLTTIQTTGFSAATSTAAAQPQGVIQDLTGNIQISVVALRDTKVRLQEVLKDVDPADPMLGPLNNVLASLS